VHARVLLLTLALLPLSRATASHRSDHFVVEAPTEELAAKVAGAAERQLKELSQKWLGREASGWPDPCQITVTLGSDGSGGSTSFVYADGRVARQEMRLQGTLDRIMEGVLPHEVTHVVFAQHFRRPFPRWADEGGATLSEGETETEHYREQMRQLLSTPDRCLPLRVLFGLSEYPRDVHAFYGAGFSVSNYLVTLKGRQRFLEFIADGMGGDWDAAVYRYYGFKSVEDLERAWLERIRKESTRKRGGEVKGELMAAPAAVVR
jgi:hypothetical protein